MFDQIVVLDRSEKVERSNTRGDLPRTGHPEDRDQLTPDSLPKWVRILVWLILGSSFPTLSEPGNADS